MRAPMRSIPPVLVLSLAACISGSSTVRVQADPAPPPPRPVTVVTPPPPPAPAPQPREAVEITVARPIRGQLPIQTNRPVYVAVFEIVPNEGVTLVQPASAQRRRITPAGLSSIPVWWKGERIAAGARPESQPTRFVYVVASEQPLRLGEQAYVPGYWQ